MTRMRNDLVLLGWLMLALASSAPAIAEGLPGGRIEHTVDHLLERAIQGLGGKRVLLQFEDQTELVVLNAITGQFEAPIRLIEKEALIATGGNIALIYYPGMRIFETWDLETGKKIKAKPSTLNRGIVTIGMGRDVAGRALLSLEKQSGSSTVLVQFDTDQLATIPGTELETFQNPPQHLALAPDFTKGVDGYRRGRLNEFLLGPDRSEWAERVVTLPFSMRAQEYRLQVMPEDRGYVTTRQWSGRSQQTILAMHELFPSVDFEYFVQVYTKPHFQPLLLEQHQPERHRPTMALYDRHLKPIWSKPYPIDQVKHAAEKSTGSVVQRRVWALPGADRLVALDSIRHSKRDRDNHETIIAITTLDPRPVATTKVAPGQIWSDDLSHLGDNIDVQIEFAPDGTTYDATTKKITWSVPADQIGTTTVIMVRLTASECFDHLIRYQINVIDN